jgi:hypothetical protein
MSIPQKVSFILKNSNDWEEWIEVVKVHALAGEVWEHVDPSKETVPTLKEPTLPQSTDVNPEAATYGQFSAEEKDDYKMLRQNYKLNLNRYN